METIVFNGWAASKAAWDLCRFRRDAIVQYLDPEPPRAGDGEVVVVGWSMGAARAIRWARANAQKVKGLILVAPMVRMMEETATSWKGMSERRLAAFLRGMQLTHGEGFFGPPPGKPNPYQADTDENLEKGLKFLHDTDVREDARALKGLFPKWIFHSERDGIVNPANSSYLKEVWPEAALKWVAGTEHALSIMIPEEIDEAVISCIGVA